MRIIIYLLLFLIFSCSDNNQTTSNNSIPFSEEIDIDDDFYFEKGVYQVIDNVYVAIGYGLANSVLIVGDTSNIIIDTTEDPKLGAQINAEFKKISNLPNEAIIYTHSHVDHWRGAPGFYEEDTKVYAHSTFEKGFFDQNNLLRPILTERGMKQFGHFLPDSLKRGHGLGFTLNFDFEQPAVIYPTNFFDQQTSQLSVGGVDLEIQHTPGETDDQIIIYYPEKDVVISADNYYMRFPNLYTIRGTPYRDLVGWVNSIDLMRYLEPEYLVPSHTRPIVGKENINTLLTTYRDAIQFVHDQTVRLMNLGLDPNEIAERLVLPKHLGDSPYLKEFYGTPEWSAKNVFSGYLGWFDGNPSSLKPLPLKDEAEKIIQLSGDWNSLFKVAEDAFLVNDFQWSLQLTDYLLRSRPDDQKTKLLRKSALEALGRKESNPNSRYYYLSSAAQLDENYQENDILLPSLEVIQKYPIESMMETLKVNVIPEKSLNKNIQLLFTFTDSPKSFSLFLRRGVLEVQPFMITGSSVQIKSSENDLKAILSGVKSLPISLVNGSLKVEGSRADLLSFFSSLRN